MYRNLLNVLEKAVVRERNSDTWEFGKGALSATFHCAAVIRKRSSERNISLCCGVAVLESERGKRF
jgi:hypothetical protein